MNKDKNTGKANGPAEGELLLPWHVTGRLEASERESVDAYLASHPDAEFHLGLIREERDVTVAENEALGGAPAGVLARLHQRIEEEDGAALERAAAKTSIMEGLRDLFTLQAPALRYAGIAAAIVIMVQAAAIGVLVAPSDRIGPYEAASHKEEGLARKGTRLAVAFQDRATAGDIAKLLEEIGGNIVGGPTPDGMYTVRVSDKKLAGEELDQLITKLEARRSVIQLVAEAE